jgi:predicted RNase H-like HicB family nuclease
MAEKNMTETAFEVTYDRDDNHRWFVRCPEVPGAHSHGRTLASARSNIREAIALVLDLPDDTDFDLTEVIRVSDTALQSALNHARDLRQRARELDEQSQAATMEAVAASDDSEDSIGMRDIAELLGISHQRVQQLAAGSR